MPQLIVQMKPERLTTRRERSVAQLSGTLGVRLTPMHPGSSDEELCTWYYAELSKDVDVQGELARLRSHPQVVAAYPKPPDEMPMS